jgi:hypothetical protein
MSKVLVRKQLDPKQAATNLATIADTSNSGTLTQLGLLNLLSEQEPLAPAAARELGYDMDSDQYKRLRMGEKIGTGLAGIYGGYRALDTLASGRSPTSAIGAGFGAYGNVLPHARRIGVRAASRGIKPAEPTSQVAVAQPQPFRQPTPQEARVNRIDPNQTVFTHQYAGSQLPRNMPEIASPTPEDKAEGYFEDEQIPVLAQQGNKSGNVAVTQSQPKGKNLTEEQMKRLMENSLDRFMDTEAKQSGAVQGA